MPHSFVILFGKAVKSIAKIRGGGSALPGLFVEKISPDFVPSVLSRLPRGVIVITGTNGKTTTTKIVVSLLESQGLKVFTNRTGSNFVRGVAAALLSDISVSGKIDADIAVLELDEAHAVKFTEVVKPKYSLLLNVMRDQLDRFGEIDQTAKLLKKVAETTTDAIVVNREDPRLLNIGEELSRAGKKVSYFGFDDSLKSFFPNDEDLHGNASRNESPVTVKAAAELKSADQLGNAVFETIEGEFSTKLNISGIHNTLNAAAGVALAIAVLGSDRADVAKMASALESVKPAFGRGEVIELGGQPIELVLVKNPAGFRLGLATSKNANYRNMIAINDNYADGRDMSWLWDVDFTSLQSVSVVSGVRAYDMALRLQYDEVSVEHVNTSLEDDLRLFLEKNSNNPKRIFCTYTAMLAIRKELSKITSVEAIS